VRQREREASAQFWKREKRGKREIAQRASKEREGGEGAHPLPVQGGRFNLAAKKKEKISLCTL